MDLSRAPESENVEDRRGMRATGGMIAGGGGLLVLVIGLLFGVDLGKLGLGGGGGQQQEGPPPNDNYKAFAGKLLGTMETVWKKEFADPRNGYPTRAYENPRLVLFTGAVNTDGCGHAPAEVGPFYCPADRKMYLDPTFFAELEQKLGGSKAEFSQAYVIAHENGHHVQNLLGFSRRVDEKRGTRQQNEYSIRLELQADYLAGVWAKKAGQQFGIVRPGDLDEALKSAVAIGDDRIMKKMGRRPFPEQFNHGTADQRKASFTAGFNTGDATMAKLEQFFKVRFDPADAELDDALFR